MRLQKNLAALTYPSLSIMNGDATNQNSRGRINGCGSDESDPDCALSPGCTPGLADMQIGAAQQHLEGGNYGFADGHVKWLKGDTNRKSSSILKGNSACMSRGMATFAVIGP